MKKEEIQRNLLDIKGNLKFTKLKKEYPEISKEDCYKIFFNKTGLCLKGHKLKFISFKQGYRECKVCQDLNNFYSINNLKEYSKNNLFTSTQIKKILEYHNLNTKDIYLWNNSKKYCPICNKERKFINQVGYAKTCSAKCGAKLLRPKLSQEQEKERQLKKQKTCIERYGVKCTLELIDNSGPNNAMAQADSIGNIKKKKTMLERYYVEYPTQNKDILKKIKETRNKNKKDDTFGYHHTRRHFTNIGDFNEEFIKVNFVKEYFLEKAFEEYFNCSRNTTLRIKRFFNMWDEHLSFPEQIIKKYLKDFIKTKKVIPPYEIDFYNEKLKFGVEVHGDYWHSIESGTDKNYHKMKSDMCKEKGVVLYQFFENEIINDEDIVASMISSKMGNNRRVYARKCIIKAVNVKDSKDFCKKTHLQGYAKSKFKLGLYYNNELIQLMTIGKPRYTKEAEYEIIRFSSKLNTTVVGGFSKLLTYFERKYKPKNIISYANRRWSEGDVYEKTGFTKIRITPPGFRYFKGGKYFAREELQKHKLEGKLNIYNNKISTKENIKNNGYLTLYDSGNIVYIKKGEDIER